MIYKENKYFSLVMLFFCEDIFIYHPIIAIETLLDLFPYFVLSNINVDNSSTPPKYLNDTSIYLIFSTCSSHSTLYHRPFSLDTPPIFDKNYLTSKFFIFIIQLSPILNNMQ